MDEGERIGSRRALLFCKSMDFLESCGVETVGIAVAGVAVAAGAIYFYLGRKSKGETLGVCSMFLEPSLDMFGSV